MWIALLSILTNSVAAEAVRIFDPRRNFQLQGFTGRGATTTLHDASTTGVSGNVGQANYAIAKGGIIAYTKSCAREFSLDRINVNTIAPGFTETRMTAVKKPGEALGIPEAIRNVAISAIPFGRAGQPEDIANVVLFFCSPLGDWVTGQLLTVDGGQFI